MPNAGHDYIGVGSEIVNPADGSISFSLPIQTSPGRQLSFPFSINYTSISPFYISEGSGPWFTWTTPINNRTPQPFSMNGWSYMLPVYQAQASASYMNVNGATNYCWHTDGFTFSGFDGRSYPLSLQNYWPDPNNQTPGVCSQTTYPWSGLGPQGIVGQLNAPPVGTVGVQPPLQVYDGTGTVYSFPTGPGISTNPAIVQGGFTPFGLLSQTVTDRNGNQISLQGNSVYNAGSTLGAGSYIDTIGRPVISWSGLGSSSGDHLTVAGLGGDIIVKWANTTVTLPQTTRNVYGSNCGFSGSMAPLTMSVVSEIDLPNGTKYSFSYGGTWGLLNQITFPNGGYTRYTWGTNPSSSIVAASWTGSNAGSCSAIIDSPAITDRYVSYDGSTETLHQTFTGYSTSWTQPSGYFAPYWSSKSTTVTDNQVTAAGWSTAAVTTYNYGAAIGGPPTNTPLENSVVYQNGSGQTLKTVNKSWYDSYTPVGEQTVLDNGQGKTTLRCPDQFGRIVATYEYNFQSAGAKPSDPSCSTLGSYTLSSGLNTSTIGPLLRQTKTVYHNYLGAKPYTNILNAPDSVTVYDGSGNQVQQTSYVYDATSVLGSGTQVGLAASPGLRGNPTSISRWLNTPSGSVTKTLTYFDTGQIASITDECGSGSCPNMTGTTHTTNYSYTDRWASGAAPGQTNAFLTTTSDPASHTHTYAYNYSTGELARATDQNGQTTSYTYSDPLARLTQASSPDGGVTTVSYNDAAPSPSTTTSVLMSGSTWKTSVTIGDGMGHVTHTQLTSDPSGTDSIDTSYNGMGLVSSVSNPHRSSTASTDGTTSFTYDALGRKVGQTQPDGSTQSWTYSGNAVVSQDENGNQSTRVSDALGRLTQVLSPPATAGAASSETDYSYDANDNLTSVNQYASAPGTADAVRTFGYDSLNRLTSASNPESGPVSYTYDANGNVSTKTDARNVTIRYCYDSLNRLLSKSSPDQGCPAPSPYAVFAYDQGSAMVGNSALQISNGVGRLTYSASSNGASGYCDAYSYDAMGRVLQKSFSWGCGGNNLRLTWTAGYDLAGNQVYYENGDWRAFYSGFNSAGQLTSLTTGVSLQSSTDATLVSGIGYDAKGAPGTINLGNGAQEQLSRDNRMRLWMDNLMPSPTATNAIFGYNVSFDAVGNIRHMNDWYAMADWDYTYDGLNRLSTAMASLPYSGWGGAGGAQTASTGCQYGYDPFGNRTSMSPYGTGKQCFSQTLNFGGNRIVTPGMAAYDAAGNTTSDTTGNTYAYDAEGRIASVSGPGGNASYLYDAGGQRVQSTVNGVTNTFGRDPEGRLAWTNFLSGGPEEVWLNGRHFGSVFANPDKSLNHVVYSQVDQVGSERGQFDANQNRIATFTSNPYGDNQQATTGSSSDTTHFTGKERDAESGLDNFGARYYGSSMGRFMSPDYSDGPDAVPFGDLENPQSLNLYGYVQNNPLNSIDEDGHLDCSGGALQDVACAVTAAAKAIGNFFSNLGGSSDNSSVTTSQTINIPDPSPPGVPEGAPGTATGPLIQAQDAARTDPRFKPIDNGPTFCNMASCYIGNHVPGTNMGPLMTNGVPNLANTDAQTLAHSGSYHQVGRAEAQRLANMGKVVFGVMAEAGHGHIITVRPDNGPYTGSALPSTGPNDPIINDIGRNRGVYPLSQQRSGPFQRGVIFYAQN